MAEPVNIIIGDPTDSTFKNTIAAYQAADPNVIVIDSSSNISTEKMAAMIEQEASGRPTNLYVFEHGLKGSFGDMERMWEGKEKLYQYDELFSAIGQTSTQFSEIAIANCYGESGLDAAKTHLGAHNVAEGKTHLPIVALGSEESVAFMRSKEYNSQSIRGRDGDLSPTDHILFATPDNHAGALRSLNAKLAAAKNAPDPSNPANMTSNQVVFIGANGNNESVDLDNTLNNMLGKPIPTSVQHNILNNLASTDRSQMLDILGKIEAGHPPHESNQAFYRTVATAYALENPPAQVVAGAQNAQTPQDTVITNKPDAHTETEAPSEAPAPKIETNPTPEPTEPPSTTITSSRTTKEQALSRFSNFGEGYDGHPYTPSETTKNTISEYQELLAANGADLGIAGVDGKYGPYTDGAHQAFCEKYQLDPSTAPDQILAQTKAGKITLENGQAPTLPAEWNITPTAATEKEGAVVDGAQNNPLHSVDASVTVDAPLQPERNSLQQSTPAPPISTFDMPSDALARLNEVRDNPNQSFAASHVNGIPNGISLAGDMSRNPEELGLG